MSVSTRVSRLWCLSLLCLCWVVPVGAVPAAATDSGCGDVTVVFARGSGQRLGQRESAAFLTSFSARLGVDVRATAYELGTASYGGARYPAVGVGVNSSDAFANLLDAASFWTGNEGGRYRASVASGVAELRAYVGSRLAACPGERVVLAGYSQGAQVVGDALPGLPRDRVAYVGLFGDPKLSLPEGRGVFPAACRGRSLSPWRRGSVGCYTDNGVLDARSPYVPRDVEGRVGSWCDRDDPVCNSNLADFRHSTHGSYARPGNAVDQAARESAVAVRAALGKRGQKIDVTVSGPSPALSARPGTAVVPVSAARRGEGPTASAAPSPPGSGPATPSPSGSPAPSGSPGPAVGGADSGASGEPGEAGARRGRAGRPAAALAIDEYWAAPGTSVRFDASASELPVGAYRWDFDGDGVVDRTTTTPVVDHVYLRAFSGRAWLRLTAADGAELMTSARMHVDRAGLAPRLPSAPDAVTVRAAHGERGAVVRWEAPAAPRAAAWRIHDADGRLLAHVPPSVRQVDLAALPDRTTTLTVEAVNEYGSSAPSPAAPRGAGSSRFGKAVPAADVGGGLRGSEGGGPAAAAAPAPAGPPPRLTTGLVAVAVAFLLTTTGALWFWLLRTRFEPCSAAGRHRRKRWQKSQ
ncbi:cutinase family protein [Cryptosporangium phraense]|uniref:Cutinase family protein n=1 Tax=Cryptosporangium phraense TaxID=2593070 RepID=A0A545AFP5_9ACTN|nr:cutinase family protein [Cryptosporangium phraense]TQS40154.1 cutinase family protein [Cryptosporangium phraense]